MDIETFSRYRLLSSVLGRANLCRLACDLIAQMLEVNACSILLADPQDEVLHLAGSNYLPPAQWEQATLPLNCKTDPWTQVFQKGESLLIETGEPTKRMTLQAFTQPLAFSKRSPSNFKYGGPQCLIAPIETETRRFGIATLADPLHHQTFGNLEKHQFKQALNKVAIALDADDVVPPSAQPHCDDPSCDETFNFGFLLLLSHELRTPLAAISGALPLIDPTQREIDPGMLAQVQKILTRNCRRLTNVVNAVLDVSEIESGVLRLTKQSIDVHEVLEETIRHHEEAAESRRLSWNKMFEAEPAITLGDRRRVIQIFEEMIGNAIKFSRPGSTVTLKTRNTGTWLEIEFTNTGVDIHREHRENIFEKFFQEDSGLTRAVSGVGLGLFLVRHLVSLHGGQIELIDSATETFPDETRFVLRLIPATQGSV